MAQAFISLQQPFTQATKREQHLLLIFEVSHTIYNLVSSNGSWQYNTAYYETNSVVHGNKSQCGKGEQQYLEKNSSNLHYYSASIRIIGIFHKTIRIQYTLYTQQLGRTRCLYMRPIISKDNIYVCVHAHACVHGQVIFLQPLGFRHTYYNCYIQRHSQTQAFAWYLIISNIIFFRKTHTVCGVLNQCTFLSSDEISDKACSWMTFDSHDYSQK